MVGAAHHVEVHAGLQGDGGGLDRVGGDAVGDQLADRVVVGDIDAVEAPAGADEVGEPAAITRHGPPGDVDEGRHDGDAAGLHRRLEGRQIDLVQRAVGELDRGVVAPGDRGAVGGEVLGRGGERRRRGGVGALKARDLGARHGAADDRVLARPLDDAAPAGIAGDVEHRCEGQRQTGVGRLLGGDAGGLLPEIRAEARRLADRRRGGGEVAVDDVEAEEQRDLQPALLHRHLLQRVDAVDADEVQHRAEAAGADVLDGGLGRRLRPGDDGLGASTWPATISISAPLPLERCAARRNWRISTTSAARGIERQHGDDAADPQDTLRFCASRAPSGVASETR